MKRRTKLCDRVLPAYSKGEEVMNMTTHIVGGSFGILVLLLTLIKTIPQGNPLSIAGCTIYGVSMIVLYTMSSIYHGLRPGTGKKVMQILDHCSIYYLIVGTYTAILTCAMIPAYPLIGWSLLAAEWTLAALATILTAIDLKKYKVFSMLCYICMGWAILPFMVQIAHLMTLQGFLFLLIGGIVYTIGAVLFGIGAKVRWIHCIFHIFVVIGSILQFISIYFYAI